MGDGPEEDDKSAKRRAADQTAVVPRTGSHAFAATPAAVVRNTSPGQTLADRIGLPGLGTPVALLSLPGDRPFNPAHALPIGHYLVGEVLGEGGMGQVRAARETDLGRIVAMKTLRPDLRGQEPYIRALVFEARLTGQLEHPNIVPVYEIGTLSDGTPYYTMQLVGELSLKDVLRQLREENPFAKRHYTLPRLLQYFRGICNAVEYAHARGVIHRDLKPENVLIGDYGEVQILDWGVARVLPHDGRPSYFAGHVEEMGVVIGTPHYMSPEQARGDTHLVDARSDVYALGVILYQILTHTLPHSKSTTSEQIDALLGEPIMPPSERAPERNVPAELERICMKALAPARIDRFGSVRELWDDIEAFQDREKERERLRALAHQHVVAGDAAAARYYRTSEELLMLDDEVKKDELATRHIDPLPARKAAWDRRLLSEERKLVEARVFGEAVLCYQRALAHDPTHGAATRALVALYRHRAMDARHRGEAAESILYADLARGLSPPLVGAYGTLNVRTYPEGAKVRIIDLAREKIAAEGTSPMVAVKLEPGSYLVAASLPGHAERRISAIIEEDESEQVLLSLVSWDAALPLVARGDDLTAMKDAFMAVVAERRLGSMMVTGEAGLGKRKLLDELGQWLDNLPEVVIYGAVRMSKATRHVPLCAIDELVAHRSGISREDPPAVRTEKLRASVKRAWEAAGTPNEAEVAEVAELMGRLPSLRSHETPTGPEEAVKVFGAIARWLKKQAEVSPIVLAFRGAEHIDRLTRDLLYVVAAELQDSPVFCLFFARDDLLQLRADQTLKLVPLERERIRHQLALLVRGTISDEVLDVVHEKSQGNAFLVAELVRLLLATKRLVHDGRAWRLADRESLIGKTLVDLLAAELTRLSPEAPRFLARAAVFGTTFWREQFGDDVEDVLGELMALDVIVQRPASRFRDTHEYAFRHDSLQRRLYQEVPAAERAEAHVHAGEWMARTLALQAKPSLVDVALAARHLEKGGEVTRARALRQQLVDEAARWERPGGPDWFAWPATLDSALLDWT